MLEAQCPQCGAPMAFRAITLPVKVCDSCGSLAMWEGDGVRLLPGKAASVPDDVSPLQIGTQGVVDGVPFELLGRIRWRWEDGGWSEWSMLLLDGTTAWLGESMGRYMVLREAESRAVKDGVIDTVRQKKDPKVGAAATIAGVDYVVTDARGVRCLGSEGELPRHTPVNTRLYSVDLGSRDARCACIQREESEVSVYAGRYVTLEELRPTNLRRFKGWALPAFGA